MKSIVSQVIFEQRKENRNSFKILTEKFYSDGCLVCAENVRGCLDAHHVFPENKDFSIFEARDGQYSSEELQNELDKCVCLCKNCHHKVHLNKIKLEEFTDTEYYRKFPKQNVNPTKAIKNTNPGRKIKNKRRTKIPQDGVFSFIRVLNSTLRNKH